MSESSLIDVEINFKKISLGQNKKNLGLRPNVW